MLLELSIYSDVLKSNSFVNVIIPHKISDTTKTLWLLHGGYSDHTEWCKNTNIEKYVSGKDVFVVMPCVDTCFYADMINGKSYFTYLTQELPKILKDIYNINLKGDVNYVAGTSMGGYGVFKMALNYPDKYSMAAALSGSMDLVAMYDYAVQNDEQTAKLFETVYGSIDNFVGSNSDLFSLVQERKNESNIPKLYMCCGTDDFLYHLSKSYVDHLRRLDVPFVYEEDEGGTHSYDYWDIKIQRVLEWM